MLRFLLKNSNMDIDDVRNCINDMENKKILDKHPHSIWEGKDSYWRTYLPDETKKDGRRLVKKRNESDIKKTIINFYKAQEEIRTNYFKDVYERWLKKYSVRFTSQNTLVKYKSDYNRFFKNKDFENMVIGNINEEIIVEFVIDTIRKLELTPKACKTMCGYIRNTLKSAKMNHLIEYNPFDDINIKDFYPYCTRIIKTAEERTISSLEYGLLYEQFQRDYEKNPNYIPTYAVEFASLTGFRVSEIVALKWSDIQNGAIIVNKSEKYDRTTKTHSIGSTKNGKVRYMPLTDEIISLLTKLKRVKELYGYTGEYIFSNENGRITASVLSSCAKNKCIQLGIPVKPIHAYRRTFSSKLKCNGVSSTVVSALMGHTEEVNEQYYTYDVTDIREKQVFVQMITKEIAMHPLKASNQEIVISSNQ